MKLEYTGRMEQTPITEAFAKFLEKSLENDSTVAYVDADLMALIGVRDVWKKYPERVLNTGIMEANMIGVAAGLSLAGFKPYVHSFAAFAVRRAFDQIFTSVAYAKKTMHIIGSEPGVKQDFNGGTHMTFEDLAIMRTIPDIHIFDITDTTMLLKVLEQTRNMQGVFYYRVPMAEIVKVYGEESEMQIGKGNLLCEGTDASIIACGPLVAPAMEAAELLKNEGIRVRVVDMFTIKPLDEELVKDCVVKTGAIVTAENASVNGGLGEAVSRYVAENCPTFVKAVAVRDEFGEVGPESYLFKRFGFTSDNIAKKVREVVELKKGTGK